MSLFHIIKNYIYIRENNKKIRSKSFTIYLFFLKFFSIKSIKNSFKIFNLIIISYILYIKN